MNELSIFKKMPETKLQVEHVANEVKQLVLEGDVCPLLFAAQVSAMEKLFTTLKQDHLIKDCVLSAAEKYGKSFDKGNAKFQIKEVGVTYDYSECNDSELEKIDNEIKLLTEKRKSRENFLKSISPESEVYGSDGVQLFAPVKKSSTQVVVTLK